MSHIIRGKEIGLRLVEHIGAISRPKAAPVNWHTHDGFEVLFLMDGEMFYEFRGKPTIRVTGGSFFIVPPKLEHRAVNSVETPSRRLGLECLPRISQATRLTPLTTENLRWLQRVLVESCLSVRTYNGDLRRDVTQLFRLTEHYADKKLDPLAKTQLRVACCNLLFNTAMDLSRVATVHPNEVIAAATRFLDEHCHERLQVTDLVKHLGFSRARVFELFKAATGMTPNDYLLRCRVRKAQTFLANPQNNITDVALAVGFSSSQYFSQVFRKYTGQSPHHYRASLTSSGQASPCRNPGVHRKDGPPAKPEADGRY